MMRQNVIATVGGLKIALVLLFACLMLYRPATEGVSYFSYTNLSIESMYVHSFGAAAYILILFFYILLFYVLITNLIYFNKLIYIKSEYLYYMWLRVCRIDEINLDEWEMKYFPISIVVQLQNGGKKSLNTSLAKQSSEEIFQNLKKACFGNSDS